MDRELTEHEQGCLEHIRQAQAEGISLVAYARAHGLGVRMLYDALGRLGKKGVIEGEVKPAEGARLGSEGMAGKGKRSFVAVRIEPAQTQKGGFVPVFRLNHVGGHVLEFGIWPPAEVMAMILAGGRNDKA